MPRRPKYHPNAPKRLIRQIRRLRSMRAVARAQHVNPRYVHDLAVKGIAPANPIIAERLYCKVTRQDKLKLGDRRRRHVRWWLHKLTADQRNQLIYFLYHYKEKNL